MVPKEGKRNKKMFPLIFLLFVLNTDLFACIPVPPEPIVKNVNDEHKSIQPVTVPPPSHPQI